MKNSRIYLGSNLKNTKNIVGQVFFYNAGHLEFTFWLPGTNRNVDI